MARRRYTIFFSSLVILLHVVQNHPLAKEGGGWLMSDHGLTRYRHREGDDRTLAKVAALVSAARQRWTELAGLPDTVAMTVWVVKGKAEFSSITNNSLPDWGGAVSVPSQRLVVLPTRELGKPLEQIVAHEVSHILLHATSKRTPPRWFDEGLAMATAGEWTIFDSFRLARGVLLTGLVPLSEIDGVLGFSQDKAWLAYAESFAAVRWIVQTTGEQGLSKLIRSLAQNQFETALVSSIGMSEARFQAEWRSQALGQYTLTALADDWWLWSLVMPVLFFSVLIVKRYQNQRLRRVWEKEDELW